MAIILEKPENNKEEMADFLHNIKQSKNNMEEMIECLNNIKNTLNNPIFRIQIKSEDFINKTNKKLEKVKESDPELFESWKKIEQKIKFIYSSYFTCNILKANIEEQVIFEQIINKYVNKIFENYFSLPENIRRKEGNFLNMTLSQLQNIEKELEKISLIITEEINIKMKINGKFLENRF